MTLRLQDLLEGPRTPLHRSGLNNTASKGRGIEGIAAPSASRSQSVKIEEESKKKVAERAVVEVSPPPKITRDEHEDRLIEVREI